MGAKNQDVTHFATHVKLGSPSADDAIIAGAYFYNHRKCQINKAVFVNGAAIPEDANNFAEISLLNGSDTVASINTNGGIDADTGYEMTLVEAQKVVAKESTLTVKYDETEGYKEITSISCIADDSDSLDGTFFYLYDADEKVCFWIDTDNSGTTEPSNDGDRSVEITTIATDDDADTVATKIAAVIDNDASWSAAAVDNVITVTDAAVGARTDAVDGDTGFTISVTQQGADAVAKALTDAIMILYGFFY